MPSAFVMAPSPVELRSPAHLSVDVNHNRLSVGSGPRTPTSPNPLDNEFLSRRRSTGLSAFNDFVDLVKRHLMYAVREEVEILKQQIGEMSERINQMSERNNQLEYENNVLRSEAKPETLSKLMQSRIPSTSQPTGQSQSTHQPPQAASQPQSAPQQLAPAPSAVVPSQLPAPQPQGVSGQPGLPPSTT